MSRSTEDARALCAPYVGDTGLDGASITTFGASAGGETVAASDATAARIDELQLDLGIGPAWDAVVGRLVVQAPALRDESRWPVLRDACLDLGAASLVAFPLAFGGVRIGAVTTYATRERTLDGDELAAITAQTHRTAVLLMAESASEAARESSANPRSRRVVHQATGMVIARFGLSAADALSVLQGHAFALGIPVSQVAADIVGGRSDLLDPDEPAIAGDAGEETR